MNEMLGNQYFLAGRYKEASTQFEKALLFDPENNVVKKKLILCLIHENELRLAVKMFAKLVQKNISVLTDNTIKIDNCPCRQIIYEIENGIRNLSDSDKSLALGMLWLYCDIRESKKYFNTLYHIEPENNTYNNINKVINSYFTKKSKGCDHEKKGHFA